jgi:hypothetical protein
MFRRSIAFGSLACAALLLPGGAAAAGTGKTKPDPDRILCIHARDAAGRPVARQICRTAAIWRAMLRDVPPKPSIDRVEPFISPDYYYGAH